MLYRALADGVLVVHLTYVVFAVLGGLLVLRHRGVVCLHLPAVAWAAAIQFGGWICPLTPLENTLRRLGGQAGYPGGFLEHYLLSVLYPASLTREIQLALGVFVLALNVAVYGWLLRVRRVQAVHAPSASAIGGGEGLTGLGGS